MKTSLKLSLYTLIASTCFACSTATQTPAVSPVTEVPTDQVAIAAGCNSVVDNCVVMAEPSDEAVVAEHEYVPTGTPLAAPRGRLTVNGHLALRK